MYGEGQGLTLDSSESQKWFLRAAEQGSIEAQYNLGAVYENGKGVDVSYPDAYFWYLIALSNLQGRDFYHTVFQKLESIAEELNSSEISRIERDAQEWLDQRN